MTKENPCEIWLTNFNAVSVEIGPMELCGFNLGSFTDKPAGVCLSICIMFGLCFCAFEWQVRITNLICLPFSFNTDSGVLPGTAESLRDYILSWKITSDTMPFVRVGSTSKTLTCLANLACDATQSNGLTELTMEGHDLSPKLKDSEHHDVFLFRFTLGCSDF